MAHVVDVVTFFVEGVPVPQGSKVAGMTKDKRPFIRDSNDSKLRPWRKAVAAAAASAYTGEPLVGAVVVHVEFSFVQPASVTRDYPSVKPDVDKLLRAVLDGIGQGKRVWADDAQVVTLRGQKVYADRAGALVRVGVIEGIRK